MDENLALLVVTNALMSSYPTWTDEHGTNVEQLAAIAVRALASHGLVARDEMVLKDTLPPAPSPAHS